MGQLQHGGLLGGLLVISILLGLLLGARHFSRLSASEVWSRVNFQLGNLLVGLLVVFLGLYLTNLNSGFVLLLLLGGVWVGTAYVSLHFLDSEQF